MWIVRRAGLSSCDRVEHAELGAADRAVDGSVEVVAA